MAVVWLVVAVVDVADHRRRGREVGGDLCSGGDLACGNSVMCALERPCANSQPQSLRSHRGAPHTQPHTCERSGAGSRSSMTGAAARSGSTTSSRYRPVRQSGIRSAVGGCGPDRHGPWNELSESSTQRSSRADGRFASMLHPEIWREPAPAPCRGNARRACGTCRTPRPRLHQVSNPATTSPGRSPPSPRRTARICAGRPPTRTNRANRVPRHIQGLGIASGRMEVSPTGGWRHFTDIDRRRSSRRWAARYET